MFFGVRKLDFNDFSTFSSNRYLMSNCNDQTLNFCSCIASDVDYKLSVIAKYEYEKPDSNRKFVTLNDRLQPVLSSNFENYYYGVSPAVDSELIIDAVSGMKFSTQAMLDEFIAKHCQCFMLHEDQSDYLLEAARYFLIAYSLNYGIKIKMDKTAAIDILQSDPSGLILKFKDGFLSVCGCPTVQISEQLNKLRFSKRCDGTWLFCDSGEYTIEQIYSDSDNIRLINGNVFYSGVLFRPLRFELLRNRYENYKTNTVCVYFERTTFAVVFALDRNFVNHPLLAQNDKISKILFQDDECKRKLLNDISAINKQGEYVLKAFEAVNEYLSGSINVNQICVSGNVFSQDKFLLMGKRAANTIDSGIIYPGVNGNAELLDPAVKFYKESMYVDCPESSIKSNRIDFSDEIGREAYAELKFSGRQQNWICQGITLSGNIPNKNEQQGRVYDQSFRRMHFNIIFMQDSDMTFSELVDASAGAAEDFETNSFLGIKVNFYKNAADQAMHAVKKFLGDIVKSKDFIESLMLLILFAVSLLHNERAFGDASSVISLILAGIIFTTTVFEASYYIARARRNKKRINTITVLEKQSFAELQKKIKQYFIKNNYKFHPAAYAAMQLHIEKQILNFYNNDNR